MLETRLIEWLFGGSPRAGEGRALTVEWTAPWDAWITLVLLIAAAGTVIVIYVLERSHSRWPVKLILATVRLTLVGLIVFMLYRGTLHEFRTDLPDVVIVLDDSKSMQIADRYSDEKLTAELERRCEAAGLGRATRLNLAKTLLLEKDAHLLKALDKRYNLKLYRMGRSLRAETGGAAELTERLNALRAEQPASRLGTCVRSVLQQQRGRPTAAIIILTDGITTDGKTIGDVAEYARRKGVPLIPVGLGNDRPPRDLRLSDLLADRVVFVGDTARFEFQLTGVGLEGRQVEVRLKEKGKQTTLARKTVTVGPDGRPQRVRLLYRPPREGRFQYVVEVAPLAGEAKTDNNRQWQTVKVSNYTIKILLVQAYPNFEFRFLKRMLSRQLKADGKNEFELTTVLQDADLEYAEIDKTAQRVFPVRRDDLLRYDVIIFGDVNPQFLSRSVMSNIADFVKEQGRGIVFIAGPRYTPLAYRGTPLEELLPVDLSSAAAVRPDADDVLADAFAVRPTPLGLDSPQMQLGETPQETRRRWEKLPGLYWMLQTPDLKPAARVLAEHPTRTGPDGRPLPLITMQFVGAGKVVFHAVDETWRWRWRIGDALFARYWVQTIRYVSRSQLLGQDRSAEMTTDRAEYDRGDPVRLRVRFFDERAAPAEDDGVTVVLERAGSKSRRIQLRRGRSRGVFEGVVANLAKGSYHGWMAAPTLPAGAPSSDFTVRGADGEDARIEMDRKDLERAAERSKGRYYTMADAHRLLRQLPPGRQVPVEALDTIPIWNSNLVVGLFLLLLVTEWLLRKRAGML